LRALLVYNPNATTTNAAVTDVIARALSAACKLEVAPTKRRDHAGYIAAGAADEGVDVVFALGGDGTVNEVIQGLANTNTTLAIIPGGSTNVWARSLGLPNDAVEATSRILSALAEQRTRRVNLGMANGRFFCFAAGYGYDAAVVRAVERRHRLKRTVRQASFIWSGITEYTYGYPRRRTAITVTVPGSDPVEGCKAAVCGNSSPYTYLGPLAARLCPGADLDDDLAVTAITRLSLPSLLRVARAALSGRDVGAVGTTRLWRDAAEVEFASEAALPLQLDGDYVGETTHVALRSARGSLTVVA
jgi:diacylglycerol kinase family enzyme